MSVPKLLVISVICWSSCTAKQNTVCEDPKSASCPTSPNFGGGGGSAGVKITSISPLVAKPGQDVTVQGLNLTSDTVLRLGDVPVAWTSIGGNTGSFVMPATPRAGAFAISVSKGSAGATGYVESAAKFMIADSAGDAYPIYMATPDEICSPKAFRDAAGELQVGTKACGPTGIDPWDLRVGVTVGGVTGKLKVNCRNKLNSAIYNYDGNIADITEQPDTSGLSYDVWDTIDDYNNFDSLGQGAPIQVVTGWDNYDCGGIEVHPEDSKVWKDVTTSNGVLESSCTISATNCTMKDKISGLWWSRLQAIDLWQAALATCLDTFNTITYSGNLTVGYNGQTGWRLPTQKELQDAYSHGIFSAESANWITAVDMVSDYFWSSTSYSDNATGAWGVYLSFGMAANQLKSFPFPFVCVR